MTTFQEVYDLFNTSGDKTQINYDINTVKADNYERCSKEAMETAIRMLDKSITRRFSKKRKRYRKPLSDVTTHAVQLSNNMEAQMPNGWDIKCLLRKRPKTAPETTEKNNQKCDFYFTAPDGKRLRSIKGCKKWFTGHNCYDAPTIIQQLKNITKTLRLKHR